MWKEDKRAAETVNEGGGAGRIRKKNGKERGGEGAKGPRRKRERRLKRRDEEARGGMENERGEARLVRARLVSTFS